MPGNNDDDVFLDAMREAFPPMRLSPKIPLPASASSLREPLSFGGAVPKRRVDRRQTEPSCAASVGVHPPPVRSSGGGRRAPSLDPTVLVVHDQSSKPLLVDPRQTTPKALRVQDHPLLGGAAFDPPATTILWFRTYLPSRPSEKEVPGPYGIYIEPPNHPN